MQIWLYLLVKNYRMISSGDLSFTRLHKTDLYSSDEAPSFVIIKFMNDKCPICADEYSESDKRVLYHVTYKPKEITTYACTGCNFAEDLIQHPEKEAILNPEGKYYMKKRKELVRSWTLKNRTMIA
jgi:uncharacterized protein YlaI